MGERPSSIGRGWRKQRLVIATGNDLGIEAVARRLSATEGKG